MSIQPQPHESEDEETKELKSQVVAHAVGLLKIHGYYLLIPEEDNPPGVFCSVYMVDENGRQYSVSLNKARLKHLPGETLFLRISTMPDINAPKAIRTIVNIRTSNPDGPIVLSQEKANAWTTECMQGNQKVGFTLLEGKQRKDVLSQLLETGVDALLTKRKFDQAVKLSEYTGHGMPYWIRESFQVQKLLE